MYEQARVGAPPAGPRVWLSEERAAAGEAAGEEGAPEGAAQAEEVVPMDAQVVEMGMEAVAQGQE